MGWAPEAGPDIQINFIKLKLVKPGVALGADKGQHSVSLGAQCLPGEFF